MKLSYRDIPQGTILYRGSIEYKRMPAQSQLSERLWMAYQESVAKIYGYVCEFRATRSLKLIEMDKVSNLETLHDMATKTVQKALEEAYPIVNGEIIRKSESDLDNIILNFVCSLGFDGITSESLRKSTDSENRFHAELAICDSTAVEPVKCLEMSEEHKLEARLTEQALRLKESRRKPARRPRPPMDDDDEDFAPRRLFD